jgi:hypothetical protein
MIGRFFRRRPVDLCLNLVFVTWVMYFVITGYVIPKPLIRHAARPPTIEKHEQTLPLPENAPVLVIDQDS